MTNAFGRIDTNRVTLKRHLATFQVNKLPTETIVAPRPLPGQPQYHYFALVKLEIGSPNHRTFSTNPRFKRMSAEEFAAQVNAISYSWTA